MSIHLLTEWGRPKLGQVFSINYEIDDPGGDGDTSERDVDVIRLWTEGDFDVFGDGKTDLVLRLEQKDQTTLEFTAEPGKHVDLVSGIDLPALTVSRNKNHKSRVDGEGDPVKVSHQNNDWFADHRRA